MEAKTAATKQCHGNKAMKSKRKTPEAGAMTVQALQKRVQEFCRDSPHLTSRIEKAGFIVLLRSIQEHR